LLTILKRLEADVVHCPYIPFPGLWTSPPLVVTIHDLIPILFPEAVKGSLKGRFPGAFTWLHRRAIRIARRIVTVSAHTAEDVRRLFPDAEKKIRVVPNGVRVRDPLGEEAISSMLEGLGIQRPYVLHVGRRDPYKRIDLLVHAFARIADRVDARLVLVGQPDPRFPEVEQALAATRLGERVRVIGYVAGEGLDALYQGAHLVAHPSIYEGFGLPLLEAMAAGTPVVACRAASIPEVTGDAALLVEPGDVETFSRGLLRLYEDGVLRERLKEAGRARAALFPWSRTARETAEAYAEVIG
jgi:glycosyltransferase involved in cell wall biosynthesis